MEGMVGAGGDGARSAAPSSPPVRPSCRSQTPRARCSDAACSQERDCVSFVLAQQRQTHEFRFFWLKKKRSFVSRAFLVSSELMRMSNQAEHKGLSGSPSVCCYPLHCLCWAGRQLPWGPGPADCQWEAFGMHTWRVVVRGSGAPEPLPQSGGSGSWER